MSADRIAKVLNDHRHEFDASGHINGTVPGQGTHDCFCGEVFADYDGWAAHVTKRLEALTAGSRWFAPAYRAHNGNVCVTGNRTVRREYAEQDVARMKADTFMGKEWRDSIFLAYQDMPEWLPVDEGIA